MHIDSCYLYKPIKNEVCTNKVTRVSSLSSANLLLTMLKTMHKWRSMPAVLTTLKPATFHLMSRMYTTTNTNVGFIGIGNMGARMAKNLLSKNYVVRVFDISDAALNKMNKFGAIKSASVVEIAKSCSQIITMLPTDTEVNQVYRDIFQNVKEGSFLVDCSTVDPALSIKLETGARSRNINFVDAPVSGGINAAENGILTFMVGGSKKNFQFCRSLLSTMGKNIIHCGGPGCGSATKLCNNMMAAISAIGYSETINLGLKLGLDAKVLNTILNLSSGRTWCSDVYSTVPNVMESVPSSHNYEGGFATDLMTKDLRLGQAAANRTFSTTMLGSTAFQIYTMLSAKGYSKRDFGIVYKFLSNANMQ